MWEYYTKDQQFDSTSELIITIYKRAQKGNGKNEIDLFHHEQRKNSIFELEVNDKFKPVFPNGMFLCNDSNKYAKSLLFVFPIYNRDIDAYLAQHWHFLLKETKHGETVGLHETIYIPYQSRCFTKHDNMNYRDPISLPTDKFDKYYIDEPLKREALIDLISACKSVQIGGMRRPLSKSRKLKTNSVRSARLARLFDKFETQYKTNGVKMLYIISFKREDGTFDNSLGFVSKGRQEKTGDVSTVLNGLVFNTPNSRETVLRAALLENAEMLEAD